MHRPPLLAAAVACGCALLSITGCGSASSNSTSTTSAPTVRHVTTTRRPTTTIDEHDADIKAVKALYDRWADLVLAKTDPDATWDDVDLTDYLAGPLLAHITKVHAERVASGEVLRRPSKSVARHTVLDVKLDGNRATIETCEVDDGIVESKDGVVINDNVTTFHDRTTASRTASGWRLTESDRLGSEPGAQRCD
jgi:hypothetical protein